MSTVEYQDRVSSRAWQREAADRPVAGHGAVQVEFFDEGCSRRLPWSSCPRAAALPAELSSPDRRSDAVVVVGEYERAFSGDEFAKVMVLFERPRADVAARGRRAWVREDPVAQAQAQALVMVLGARSQREGAATAASGAGGDASPGGEQGR